MWRACPGEDRASRSGWAACYTTTRRRRFADVSREGVAKIRRRRELRRKFVDDGAKPAESRWGAKGRVGEAVKWIESRFPFQRWFRLPGGLKVSIVAETGQLAVMFCCELVTEAPGRILGRSRSGGLDRCFEMQSKQSGRRRQG